MKWLLMILSCTHRSVPYSATIPPLRAQGTMQNSRQKECKIQSGIEAIRRTRPSESIKAHMDSERLKHQAQGLLSLQEVLFIYIITSSFRFLWDPWVYDWVGFWLLCLFLGLFVLCWPSWSSLNVMIFLFFLFYWFFILSYLVVAC